VQWPWIPAVLSSSWRPWFRVHERRAVSAVRVGRRCIHGIWRGSGSGIGNHDVVVASSGGSIEHGDTCEKMVASAEVLPEVCVPKTSCVKTVACAGEAV